MALAPHAIDERPLSVDRVPTLTEVVDFGPQDAMQEVPTLSDLVAAPLEGIGTPGPGVPAAVPDAEVLVERVMRELSPRIDMLLESRLREALAPALARAADGLIRESREGVARTLRELVEEAVARALHQRSGE
jgi:hypothetical protein